MPVVSILIPTYNGAAHIRPAIDSVISQVGIDLEIIVSDDNSSDDTAEIVLSYTDPRIRLVRNAQNLGPQGNWNHALELATGTYVKLLPQDDTLHPGTLAKQIAVLEGDREKRIALVFGAREIIDTDGKVIARRGLAGVPSGRIAAAVLARLCVRKGTNVIGEPGAVLFRRDLAREIGWFDATQPYVIDLDYWLRLLAHGDAWYLANPISAFRVSSGSWSVAIGSRQSEQYSAFLERMRAGGLIDPSSWDVTIGKLNARLNNLLRLVFYKVIVR